MFIRFPGKMALGRTRKMAGSACIFALLLLGAGCAENASPGVIPPMQEAGSARLTLPAAAPGSSDPCDPQSDALLKGRTKMDLGDCQPSCVTEGTCQVCPDGTLADVCATDPSGGSYGGGAGGGGNPCPQQPDAVSKRSAQSVAGQNCGPTPGPIAYPGKPMQGARCQQQAPLDIGAPLQPGTDNVPPETYYVDNEAAVFENGNTVGFVYEASSADNRDQHYTFIQLLNNSSTTLQATFGITASMFSAAGSYAKTYQGQSPVEWLLASQNIPTGDSFGDCWPDDPFPIGNSIYGTG